MFEHEDAGDGLHIRGRGHSTTQTMATMSTNRRHMDQSSNAGLTMKYTAVSSSSSVANW